MPHRIQLASSVFAVATEGVILGSIAAVSGARYAMTTISDGNWDKLIGPHSLTFGAVIAVIVLWTSRVVESRKQEAARERRHQETVSMQGRNADKLLELTKESILAQGKATLAINSMDRTVQSLTIEIKDRPCQAASFKPQIPPCPVTANPL